MVMIAAQNNESIGTYTFVGEDMVTSGRYRVFGTRSDGGFSCLGVYDTEKRCQDIINTITIHIEQNSLFKIYRMPRT